MKKKYLKKIKKEITTNKYYYTFLLVILLLNIIKLDYYIFSPGSLINLDNRIIVENAYPEEGSINLTYVTSRNGTIFNILLSYIIPTWDKVPASELQAKGESASESNTRRQIDLKATSYDAIIAAFNEAGIEYKLIKSDLTVTYIYDIANTTLKVGDIIKKIDNVEVNDLDSLHEEINKHKSGDKITITILRNNKEKEETAILNEQEGKILIGVVITPLKEIETAPKIEYIFKNSESGSSRGLMCAIEIYNRITKEDITKGRKIAGTGVIYEDGSVGAIDGIKYKLSGAVRKKADIFIVPKENYEEAIEYKKKMNYKIKIISADNLKNVIEELKK